MGQQRLLITLFILISTIGQSSSQEIGFEVGLNKITYHPFYRAFSESYHPSIQSDIAWRLIAQKSNELFVGLSIQYNLQPILGDQFNLVPIARYRINMKKACFFSIQTGYGVQLLFPRKTLYSQTGIGEWKKAIQVLINQVVPFQVGFGKSFGAHSLQLNYSYQLSLGFNPSILVLPQDRWSIGYRYLIKKSQ